MKQLIDMKSNEIFVLQTAGKGTSCPACVWQTVLHAGTAVHTADVCEPALSLSRAHVYLTLCLRQTFSRNIFHVAFMAMPTSGILGGYIVST